MTNSVRVRYAPNPTVYPHVGNISIRFTGSKLGLDFDY